MSVGGAEAEKGDYGWKKDHMHDSLLLRKLALMRAHESGLTAVPPPLSMPFAGSRIPSIKRSPSLTAKSLAVIPK